jgi:hypothetical protein
MLDIPNAELWLTSDSIASAEARMRGFDLVIR